MKGFPLDSARSNMPSGDSFKGSHCFVQQACSHCVVQTFRVVERFILMCQVVATLSFAARPLPSDTVEALSMTGRHIV